MSSLNKNATIRFLARDLKLLASFTPVEDILGFCEKLAGKKLVGHDSCSSPSQLLEILADAFHTKFEEIFSDDGLQDFMDRNKAEPMMQLLQTELNSSVFGITFRRLNKRPWETAFVSVIDCRGPEKRARANHTKWHELGHLFILTDQTLLSFQRSHCLQALKDPQEQLVDIIAGHFEYWPKIFQKHCSGPVSFSRIEAIRQQLCPEASKASALIGIVKAWPSPCLLLEAEVRHKKYQLSAVSGGQLRVARSSPNPAAREIGLSIPLQWRVPVASVISAVHSGYFQPHAALEDLSLWETSTGSVLSPMPIYVEARTYGNTVQALIYPQ